ncbi:MAG TPA: TMEM175 family protein [Chitinophagaceae bacterium]|nr:TMEM175 family protein [Chitinophagaceae bacterium]
MLRKAMYKHKSQRLEGFRYRGDEVKRIETFSDAVFAFAVTLLIVSLEVPKTFEELMITMRGFLAFAISFTLLVLIWYEQHTFFRRYGLEDVKIVVLNSALMFVVLFYVYPLKFLFTLLFSEHIYGAGKNPFFIATKDFPTLMAIYGLGYIIIYTLFLFMYLHVLNKKKQLDLNAVEIFDTRTKVYATVILMSIGLLSVITAELVPAQEAGMAGFVYMLIGPAFSIIHSYRGKRRRLLYPHGE